MNIPAFVSSETSFIMASFGENLKREREMRGIPLREISDSTKINLHFLQALEDEEFDKLPGGVFNRGFIRAYSRHLGLDEQKLLGEYDLVLGSKEPFETPSVLAAPPPPLEATSSQARLLAAIAVVMLLIRNVARKGRRFLSGLRRVFWNLSGRIFRKALKGSVGVPEDIKMLDGTIYVVGNFELVEGNHKETEPTLWTSEDGITHLHVREPQIHSRCEES